MFNRFVQQLKQQLQVSLPGEEAQYRMAPQLRRSSLHYLQQNPDHKKGSVMLLNYECNGKLCLALTLRQAYNGVHSAQVSFPGGRIEPDETVIAAALRETNEEIGIEPAAITTVGLLSPLYIPASNYLVHPVVGWLDGEPMFRKDEREVAAIFDFPLIDLVREGIPQLADMSTSSGIGIRAPYYEIQGNKVWGATAMILSEFSAVLNPMQAFLY
jgi:8-oxo-dGTP pyrophosphatase MutT (NUDIX family)